jgi:hypothetical protein
MAFEQSPEFGDGGIKSRQSLRDWLMQHERGLYTITGILLVLVAAMTARIFGVSITEPGGLDGCVVTAAGEPAQGTVQVGLLQSPLYENGCFFFAELAPGVHEVLVQTADGIAFSQSVTIVSGQAVELGAITLP